MQLKKYQHLAEYAGLRFLVFMIRMLPAPLAIRLGRGIGTLLQFLFSGRMKLAHDNLNLAFKGAIPEAQRNSIISKLMKMQGESLVESMICSAESIHEHVTVEGMEHLLRALAEKKGVILLGPHFDMWELAGYIYGAQLDSVATVYKALKNPYVDGYLRRQRTGTKLELISSRNALRPVLSRLKQGLAVVMMFDQNAGRSGLPAQFFGKTAMTYSAPAAFALKTGCAVIPSYMIKEPEFRKHRLVIHEPFPLIKTGNAEADITANTQQYNDFFEHLVRQYPEQWFGWLHKRWKLPSSVVQKSAA